MQPDGVGASLSGLEAVSETDIWASGSIRTAEGRSTLVQHWDGSRWTIWPSPDGPRANNWVTGLSAVAADDAWIVGYSTDRDVGETQSETLIERWNGREWKIVPSPNLTMADVGEEFGGYPVSNELFGIADVSPDDVWAVGRSFTIVRGQELILHWEGENWKVEPVPPHSGSNGWLRGVLAISKDDVWAFGEHLVEVPLGGEEGGTGNVQLNLTLHWDGKVWNEEPSPNVSPIVNGLFRGAAASPSDVWAVGYHLALFGINQVNHPTMLHWDGFSWSLVPVPTHNREPAYLFSVAALGARDAIAVGFYDTGPPFPKIHTLIERWDGIGWSIVPSLDPGDHNYLYTVLPLFPDDIWVAGEMVVGEVILETLIERYTSACFVEPDFLRGDSNGDGRADLSDAVMTLNHLFLGTAEPTCLDAADADDTGAIVITDAIFLLGALFLGNAEIPAPFPACGADRTADDLGCGQACRTP